MPSVTHSLRPSKCAAFVSRAILSPVFFCAGLGQSNFDVRRRWTEAISLLSGGLQSIFFEAGHGNAGPRASTIALGQDRPRTSPGRANLDLLHVSIEPRKF